MSNLSVQQSIQNLIKETGATWTGAIVITINEQQEASLQIFGMNTHQIAFAKLLFDTFAAKCMESEMRKAKLQAAPDVN